jgi:ABC-2 type transport system ATP-binding protein
LIDVAQLVFEYPGHRALDGVSLHIGAGSVTALVGPNGAGKSTLMRCIAGLEQPLSGGIRVHGIAVEEQPRAVHRHLGYLSDFYGLYDRLSVARCLRYCALAMGVPADQAEARVQEVAAQLGLLELLQRRPTELSRGQRQRVAIGQAIVHPPAVLLLDEPASGLDPEARGSLSQLFRQLQARGMTLVVSSHILSELDEYCTHILSLRDGRVENHEALQAATAPDAEALALYALEIAPTDADAAQAGQRLRDALQGVQVQQMDATGARPTLLWLPAAAAQRAQWLAALVQAGVAVAGLSAVRESLQERYARGARDEHAKEQQI